MIYILKNSDIQFDWTLLKYHSYEKEDLRDVIIQAFLVSYRDRWALSVDVDNKKKGVIHLSLPKEMNLEPDVYGLKVVWAKNKVVGIDEGPLTWVNARSICLSELSNVFAITTDETEQSAPGKKQHYALSTTTATYGRDGMDAYERAVVLGMCDDETESDWIKNGCIDMPKVWKALGVAGDEQIHVSHMKGVTEAMQYLSALLFDGLATKVDKVDGMGLSENNYTDEDKEEINSLREDVDYIRQDALPGKVDSSRNWKAGGSIEYILRRVNRTTGEGNAVGLTWDGDRLDFWNGEGADSPTINGKRIATTEDVPTKVSELTNDSGLITEADAMEMMLEVADDLSQEISKIPKFGIKVVETLPTQNISTTTVYLVPDTDGSGTDLYTEYIYVDGKWEQLGKAKVDLSKMVTTDTEQEITGRKYMQSLDVFYDGLTLRRFKNGEIYAYVGATLSGVNFRNKDYSGIWKLNYNGTLTFQSLEENKSVLFDSDVATANDIDNINLG